MIPAPIVIPAQGNTRLASLSQAGDSEAYPEAFSTNLLSFHKVIRDRVCPCNCCNNAI